MINVPARIVMTCGGQENGVLESEVKDTGFLKLFRTK
jgi:hypothetical protein